MEYTKVASDAFQKLQLNAGILVDDFTPATGVIGNIIGATTGGITFNSNPTYEDFGEDVDNCPNNTMQLKRLVQFDPTMSGTLLTCTAAVVKSLIGGADVSESDTTHVIPREALETTDFDDIWWVGDYSNINDDSVATGTGGTNGSAGFIAIHLMNALNNAGFKITSTKRAKGQMAFEFHGHYDLTDTSEIPFEVYVKAGTAAVNGT